MIKTCYELTSTRGKPLEKLWVNLGREVGLAKYKKLYSRKGKLTKEIREMLKKTIHTARKFPIPVITYLMVYSWSTPYSSDGCSWAYGFLRGGNFVEWYFLPPHKYDGVTYRID